jgi:hypothetical protein
LSLILINLFSFLLRHILPFHLPFRFSFFHFFLFTLFSF